MLKVSVMSPHKSKPIPPPELVVCGVPFGMPGERDALAAVKAHGFTAVQTYLFWRDIEPAARGHFEWPALERKVRLIQDAGLKYVPFILMGPKYAAPGWWLADPRHAGLRCLEHGKESPVESVWNPAFRDEIRRVLDALATHFLPWQVIESVQPGIGGDYGEAIFPVLGNWPGDYHTHRGFWCGGADAAADLRRTLKAQYMSITRLNAAWRSNYAAFADIRPFLPHRAPSRTACFDLVSWYRASMTAYAEFWMAECRRAFPALPAYLCTGGADDETTSGALFAAQARAAARHGGGIRLTNEGNAFAYNFPLTAPTWAACRFYGAYFGLEPVGPMTTEGVCSRTFGSAAFGNRQIFHYYGNVCDKDNRPLPAAAIVRDHVALVGETEVEPGVAFFWPVDQTAFQAGGLGGEVRDALLHIRRDYPVTPLSDELVLDGALARHRCLVMIGALSTRPAVLRRIARWVREEGGLLLAVGLCRDLELEPVPEFNAIFGVGPDSEEAWGHNRQYVTAPPEFQRIGAIPSFHTEKGWLGLASDVERIACAKEGPGGGEGAAESTRTHAASALFRRRHAGGGQAILYAGYVVFKRDPQAVFDDPCVFAALLSDVCAQSGVTLLGTQDGEIARARADGRLLILRPASIDRLPANAPAHVCFLETFDAATALEATSTQGQVAVDPVGPYKGTASLRLSRAKVDMDRQPTSATLRTFPVCAGKWDLAVALRSHLHSPDSSYNGTVLLELIDADGRSIGRNELAVITGDSPWRVFRKRVELAADATSARFVVRMEKTYGEFHADAFSAVYAGPSLKTVVAIKFASTAVGNLFFPGAPVRFELTVECVKPLLGTHRVATCVLRDYWGAEFSDPIPVALSDAGKTASGRGAYRGTLDLTGHAIIQGKYYEVDAEVPETDLPEPTREGSSFAVLPLSATKPYAPFDVPFTASGWNPGVPGFFPLCDRLGLRVADVYSRWSSTPPYDVQAPGIEIVKHLGMGALMSTMAHAVEGRYPGYQAFDETALHEGAKRLVNTYKDQLPIAIRNGNEPHPADDAQALEMIAAYKAIYEGVKAADPNILVTSTSCGPEEVFFRLGFQRYYDVYDFHQYADAGVIPADFARYDHMIAKYGSRKPVWSTEIGLNSQGMARSAVAIQMIKIFTNFFACGGQNASWFGVMWPDPDATNVGTNGDSFDVFNSKYCLYSPKLTAITEYNMVSAICVKKVVASRTYAGHVALTLFRDAQDRCLLVAWKDGGREDLFLPLPGVRKVQATRLDGSSSALDAAGQGLTLALSDEPYLLQFDSAGLGLPEHLDAPRVALEAPPGPIVKGGTARLVIRCEGRSPDAIELEAPPRWTVRRDPSPAGFAGFILGAPATTEAREGRVLARLADGNGEVYLTFPIIDALEVRFVPCAFRDGAAGMTFAVRNHGPAPQTLHWRMAVPEVFAMADGTFKLGEPAAFAPTFTGPCAGVLTIGTQAETDATVRIANLDPLSLYRASLELTIDGRPITRERLFGGCVGVPKVKGGVAFDGRMGDPAWQLAAPVALDREAQYAVLNRKTARRDRPEDLSGTMRLLWDDTYLYLGLAVQDDVFCHPEQDALIWRGDGLQFLVDPCRESADKPGKYDYALGLGTKGPQAWCCSTADAMRAPTEEVTDFLLKITPTGQRGNMVYEVAIPWHRLSPFQPAPGANLGLAMIINDDDGHIRDSFIAWFGCAHSKQMSMNGDLILLA